MPNYHLALEWVQRQVEQTSHLKEFHAYARPLQVNLEREKKYGHYPDLDQRIENLIPPLDRLSLEVAGVSFTDLAFGRFPSSKLASSRLQEVAAHFGAGPLPFKVTPPVRPLVQELPFHLLNPEQFEAICFALIESQANTLHVEFRGVSGNSQEGIDIFARQRIGGGTETWAYQCKRYKAFTPSLLAEALEKMTYSADYYVLMLSIDASTTLSSVMEGKENKFLWDARNLSRKLKNHPKIVEEFFGREWRESFAVIG